MEITIATRRFTDLDANTTLVDRMVRRGRSFYLIEEPARPGEAVREIPCTRRRVFEWLREMPEQIERTVIVHSK
jgi:hypothetical protein